MKLGVIGGGNMGEAMIRGALANAAIRPEDVVLSDPSPERLAWLQSELGAAISPSNADAVSGADVVLLAVKPQVMFDVISALPRSSAESPLFISVAAGLTIGRLEAALGSVAQTPPRVIRTMPNTPCLVGAGVIGMAAGAHATAEDVCTATQLLSGMGRVISVPESQIDALTAISGSGPAYLFAVMEAMIAGGVALGLPAELAATLVQGTFEGATALAGASEDSPGVLRERVTSKGGTTAEALRVLSERGLSEVFAEAMAACARRAAELARGQ